jgi:fructokinase
MSQSAGRPGPEGLEIVAAIETGGTKTLCRVAGGDSGALAERRWPTEAPDAMAEALAGFIARAVPPGSRLAGVGLAAFGPLVVDPLAADCGRMLHTPKPGWTGANLAQALARRLGAPVAVDTDVNAAAVAEQKLGAGRGCASLAYVTVGTGIGGGLAIHGRSLKGALHPEIGHIRLVREPSDDAPSACPYHADCAEGLAAGPAIARRIGEGRRLGDAPEVRALIGGYLGQLLATLVLAWSPQRIVLGGGVMATAGLIDEVTAALASGLGDYGVGDAVKRPGFLAAAKLENAGLEGALLMARGLARTGGDHPSSFGQ